jgi:hypothetical protein
MNQTTRPSRSGFFSRAWKSLFPQRNQASSSRKQSRFRKLLFEILEDRTVPSTVTVGELVLSGEFDNDVAIGQVLVGFDETDPLIAVNDGQVTADPSNTTFTIMPSGEGVTVSISVYTLAANPTIWMSSSQNPVTFDADELVSDGHSFADDGGEAEGITVASLPDAFLTEKLALAEGEDNQADLVKLQGLLDFGTIGIVGLKVEVDDTNDVEIDSGTKDVTLTGVEAMIDDDFTVAGVEIDGSLNVGYSSSGGDEFSFGGGVTVMATGLEGASGGSNLGATLDMTVEDGDIEAITLEVSGSLSVWVLEVVPDNLTFEYSTTDTQFVMYGDITVKVPNGEASDDGSTTTSITGRFGTSDDPGLIIDKSGTVSQVNIGVFGTLNVLGFTFESPNSNPATFQYMAEDNLYELSGTIVAPNYWNASVTMGTQQQPGLKIENGNWSVDALDVSLSDVKLGAFAIRTFEVDFTQPSSTEIDFDFDLAVEFPQGWCVEAAIDTVFKEQSKAFEINDVFLKASGLQIAIGETGLFLTEIDASLQNIFQPSNLIVSGDITVEYGEAVTIFGETARFFLAQGGFTVDKDQLELDANVWVGSVSSGGSTTGLLGSGSGDLVLDWNNQEYTLDVKASLLDGVFEFEEEFEFSAGDPAEVLISAKAEVEVPHGIPLIGGDKLGSADFLFKYVAPSETGGQADGFVAAWTKIDLIFTHVKTGIEYDFVTDKVKTLGNGAINSLQKEASQPEQKTYVYSQPFTNNSGATQATLSVDWTRTFSSPPTSATVSVVLPDDTTVAQSDFASNGLSLITTSSGGDLSSDTQFNVGVVNPNAGNLTYTGSLTEGSTSVTISGATLTSAINGWAVSGTGIPAGATAFYVNGTTLKLSDPATSSVSGMLTFTNPYLALPFASGQDSTSYTLQITFTSEEAPIADSVQITSITQASGSSDILVTFSSAVPSNLQVGDTITISSSSVSGYNTSGTYMVTEIIANGVVVNQPYTENASGGTLSGWTLPQFSATYHLPPPTILINPPGRDVTTSELTVTMPVQVDTALAENTTVDLYIDAYDASAGANQAFNGILLAKNVSLNSSSETNGQQQYQASTTVDLSQPQLGLLPIEYYLYAVVNDGTNAPETSTLTSDGSGGFNEVFENVFALTGTISNQANENLNGWTVFVDTNEDGQLEPGEPSYTTTDDGFYGFYGNQIPTNTPFDVVVELLDPTAFTFDAPSLNIPASGFSIVNGGLGLSTQLTWDGASSISANFEIAQFSSISGVVSDATTGEGLDGWTAFLDSNGSGQLDPGEVSTQTAPDGTYTITDLLAGSVISITSSSNLTSPTTVLNLAGAVPSTLQVGDRITVSGSSVAGYNTTHIVQQINATSVITDQPFTSDATGGLLAGPDVDTTVALAILNGSAATYAFAANQVQGALVLDSSGGANTQQHAGTLEGGASVGTASSFGIADHANAASDNQILQLGQGSGKQFVDVPADTDLSPGTGGFSAAGWIRPELVGSGLLPGIAGALGQGGGWVLRLHNVVDFAPPQTFDAGTEPEWVAAGDFNGDNKPDLAVVNDGSNNVSVLLNTTAVGATTASFAPQQTFAVGQEPISVALGDFNDDGKPDLAVANFNSNNVSVLLNTTATGSTSATFTAQQTFDAGSGAGTVAVGDFNDDGKPDLAVTNFNSNNVSVLLNTTAAGTTSAHFASQQTFEAGTGTGYLAVGDFNGDTKPDLATANLRTVSVLLNTTAGATTASFADAQTFDVGGLTNGFAVGDLNGDTKPDLAVVVGFGDVSVFLNTTAAGAMTTSFTNQQTFAVESNPDWVSIGDLNGDAKPDLTVANFDGKNVSVLLNGTADGATTASFAAQQTFAAGSAPVSVAIGDFNGDTKSDLAVANFGGVVQILLNGDSGPRLEAVVEENGSGHNLELQDSTSLQGEAWHHVAFTYDPDADDNGDGTGAGTLKLYVNGALVASSPNRSSLPTSPDISNASNIDVDLGAQGGDGVEPFLGFLDDVSLWDQALTATQIQALFDGTTSPSYTQTTPPNSGTYAVPLSGTFDLEQGNNFTITESSTVSGTVQANALGSTQLDAAMPVAGWIVNLLDASDQVAASTTNATGHYVFAGLAEGTYRLELVLPDGWRQTAAANDGSSFTLAPGDLLEGLDFTAAQLGQLNGGLYDDLDGDGQRDPGEPGRAGATVYLDINENGQFDPDIDLASRTVDAGAYAFTGLDDGTYQLRLVPVAGRLLTSPSSGLYEVTIAGGEETTGASLDFLTAVNAPPIVTTLSTVPAFEGAPFRLEATFTDADSDTPLRDVTIAWGDGTSTTRTVTIANGTGSLAAEHVYADGGFYDVTLTVADAIDATVSTTRPFTAIVSGAGIHDGVLEVVGSDESDQVLLVPLPGGRLRVNASFLPHGSKGFEASSLTALEVTLFAGDDTTTLNLRSRAASVLPAAIHLDSGAPDSEGGDVLRLLARRQDIKLGAGEAVLDDATTITWTSGTQVLIVPTPAGGMRRTFGPLDSGWGRFVIPPSNPNQLQTIPASGFGDHPGPSDHDGEGITDIALHRFRLDGDDWRTAIPALIQSEHASSSRHANEKSRKWSIDLIDELFARWPLVERDSLGHRGV